MGEEETAAEAVSLFQGFGETGTTLQGHDTPRELGTPTFSLPYRHFNFLKEGHSDPENLIISYGLDSGQHSEGRLPSSGKKMTNESERTLRAKCDSQQGNGLSALTFYAHRFLTRYYLVIPFSLLMK